jgi:hypothetical protein
MHDYLAGLRLPTRDEIALGKGIEIVRVVIFVDLTMEFLG